MSSPKMRPSFAMGVDSFDKKPEPYSGSIVPGLRHLPRRVHDQEKQYSPALKRQGGYSYTPEKARESEEERKERIRAEYCKEHERQRNELIEAYRNGPVEEGATIENLNEYIRLLNDYYGGKGCPALPEVKPPPTLATKP